MNIKGDKCKNYVPDGDKKCEFWSYGLAIKTCYLWTMCRNPPLEDDYFVSGDKNCKPKVINQITIENKNTENSLKASFNLQFIDSKCPSFEEFILPSQSYVFDLYEFCNYNQNYGITINLKYNDADETDFDFYPYYDEDQAIECNDIENKIKCEQIA